MQAGAADQAAQWGHMESAANSAPNRARQTRSKGPARRRIMRKDRRQTLELLTSDDETNELVESRPSTYIEPSARQHLHETKPHLRSSFETLYNPQFDAPDGPVGFSRNNGDKSDEDAGSSSGSSAAAGAPQETASIGSRVNGGVGGSGVGLKSLQQFDKRWEDITVGGTEIQLTASSAAPLAAGLSKQKQHQQWQQQQQHTASKGPNDTTSVDGLPSWTDRKPANYQNQQQQQWQKQQQHSSAIEEMDRLADQLLRNRELHPPSKPSMDVTDGRNPAVDLQLQSDTAAEQSNLDWASRSRIPSSKKTVAFRLPPEEAALSQLRERISAGGRVDSGSALDQPQPQFFAKRQPVRADVRVAAAAAAAAASEEPAKPSVAQQLRAILPGTQVGEAPAQVVEVPTNRNQSRLLQSSPMSMQISADRHAPRRSGSLTRSGSYDRSGGRGQSGGSLGKGSWPVAPAGEQPMRRTWSVMQPQRPQLQRQQQQQNSQLVASQLNHQYQQQHQEDQPPPLPPRRIKEAPVSRAPSAQLMSRQPHRTGSFLVGRVDLPAVDHVYKRIRVPSTRHRVTVAPRQRLQQRPAAAPAAAAWNPRGGDVDGGRPQRHFPVRRGWQGQQYSAKFA